jgi:PAS domain S-box-containing protein
LSRDVELGSSKAVGAMAVSVNRLIGSLRRSQQLIVQLGTIVESTGDASIGLTLEGVILSWNHGAQHIYGYSLEDVKGKSAEMLFPSNRMIQFAALAHELGRKRSVSVNTIHQKKNGSQVNVRLIMNRIVDNSDKTIGISLVSRELAFAVPTLEPKESPSARAA